MKKVISFFSLLLLVSTPVNAQNFTGKSGEAIVQRGNQVFRANLGTQLYQGDRIITGTENFLFSLDYGIGTVFQRNNTTVDVTVLSRSKGCSNTQMIYSGKGISWKKRKFTNPCSSFIVFNRKGGVYVSPDSDIELTEKGDDVIAVVYQGKLEQEKNAINKTINQGFYNLTNEQDDPGELQKINYLLPISHWKTSDNGNYLFFNFYTDPINNVKVNGLIFNSDSQGLVKGNLKYPILNNAIYIEVSNKYSKRIHLKNINKGKIYR